jgi:hypothetical protein
MIRALKRLRSLRALYLPGDEIPGLSPEEEKRLIEKGYVERVTEAEKDETRKPVAKDPETVVEKSEADAESAEPDAEEREMEPDEMKEKPSGKPKAKTPRKRGSGKKGSE